MSVTSYPTLRLKLTMPQALKLQFLPAVPGSNAAAAAADAQAAADAAQAAANTAVAATADKVSKSGDVMTGFLTLNANPNTNLQAATKQYVDAQVSAGGIPEAPSDGSLYGRLNAAWAQAQPFDADLTSLAAATATNQWYYRSAANTWSPVTVGATMTFVGGVLNTTAGGGNVIASGTPLVGQWARWTSAATIEGVDASATGFQPIDADLTSIAAATVTNQWLYRSAANTWSPVTIGANLTFTGGTLAATGGGGGNVSNSGTPTAGQYGKWVTATTIQGVAPATVLSDIGAAPVGAEYITSTADATLTSERVLTDTATVTWDRTTAGQIKANAAGGGGGASISISDTPPGSPTAGSMWWESDTGALWIYYTDANTSQWVAAAGGGSVVQPGTLVLIQRQDVSSAVANIDFKTGIDATYDEYEIHWFGVTQSADGGLAIRISQDGGTTFKAGATDYIWGGAISSYVASSSLFAGSTSAVSFGLLGPTAFLANTVIMPQQGKATFWNPTSTTARKSFSSKCFTNAATASNWDGFAQYTTDTNPINGFRLFLSAGGNITAGSFILYGVKK